MSKLTYLGDLIDASELNADLYEKSSSFLTSQHYLSDDVREVTKTPIDSTFRNFISTATSISETKTLDINSCLTNISATASFSIKFNGNTQLVIVKNDNNLEPNKAITITVTNNGSTVTIYPKSTAKIKIVSGTISNSIDDLLDRSYPIGTYYWTSSNVNPSTIFGGGWTQVSDTFILAQGTTNQQFVTTGNVTQYFTYNATTTKAGAANVTISTTTMPWHNHWYGSHYHNWYQFYDNGGALDVDQSSRASSRYMQRSPYYGSSPRTDLYNTAFNGPNQNSYVQNNYDNNNPAATASHNNMPQYATSYCWRRTS